MIVLLGARTGRDGIGGASVLASAELEEGDAKRPSVQIGDPFEESKLIECCLELVDSELLVSLQDLGAAGLSSSTSEMAAKGGVGIDLDVAQVPLREAGHGAVRGHDLRVAGADAVRRRAGAARDGARRLRALGDAARRRSARSPTSGGCGCSTASELVGDMPVPALVDECPLYDLDPQSRPTGWSSSRPRAAALAPDADPDATLRALLGSANVASRRWVFEQYDCLVGSRTVRRPAQADAAVLRLALGDVTPTARSRCRSTATGGGWPPTPTSAPPRRSASARRTWPAWAPSRWASRTASTSATPRSRTSRGS